MTKTMKTYKNGRPTKAQLMEYALNSANAFEMGDVYVIEFVTPMGNIHNPKGYAKMYVGWAKQGEAQRRFQEHCNGQGASITRAAVSKGIEMKLVAVIPGTPVTERQIKNRGNTPEFVKQLRRDGKTLY